MAVAWTYLAVTLVGLWFTFQALRPTPLPHWRAIPSFFAGWLTNELVVHHFVWQLLATVGFVLAGALEHWPGWVGLAVALLQWGGNARLLQLALRARQTVEAALRDGLSADYRASLPAGGRSFDDVRWRGLVVPFWFRHPDVVKERDLVFGHAGARDLTLDVYRHRDDDGRGARPVVLFVHGGGWVIGDKREQGIPLMLEMASRGWIGVNANYRLSPWARFPEHLVDVKRAIAWIRDHAGELGADPSFVAVAGGSAGGHLAALAALTPDRPELQPGFEDADVGVQACVPFYGVYDFTDRQGTQPEGFVDFLERHVVQARAHREPERFALASPVDQVGPHAPPTFIVHGERDTLAPPPDAARFARLLRDEGSEPVVIAELPGAQHAFDVFPSVRTAITLCGVARFLTWAHRREHPAVGSRDEREMVTS